MIKNTIGESYFPYDVFGWQIELKWAFDLD